MLQVWLPLCSQGVDWVARQIPSFGPLCWGSQLLIQVCTHLGCQVWAPSLLNWVRSNLSSGVCWGCLSSVHRTGAEG